MTSEVPLFSTAGILVAILISITSALFGALFALQIARRQRFHEARQHAYERLLPALQESLLILGYLRQLEELDPSDEDALVTNLLNIVLWLGHHGGNEGWDTVERLIAKVKDGGEGSEGERLAALADLRDLARRILFRQMWNQHRTLMREQAVLYFVEPGEKVREMLGTAVTLFRRDLYGFEYYHLLRETGLGEPPPGLEVGKRTVALTEALEGLREAMGEELKQTL